MDVYKATAFEVVAALPKGVKEKTWESETVKRGMGTTHITVGPFNFLAAARGVREELIEQGWEDVKIFENGTYRKALTSVDS